MTKFKLFVGNNYGVQTMDGEVIFDSIRSIADADVLVDLLNDFDEHIKELKQEVELLREGLEAYEDNLPVYLNCKEVNDFHSDIYDFKKKQQSFYNEHPNRCKIIVDGVELK